MEEQHHNKQITDRTELDDAKCPCGKEGCPVKLNSQCHPGAPTQAQYNAEDGTLELLCVVCGGSFMRVVVGFIQ